MGEDLLNRKVRGMTSYGKLADYRHENGKTFEFRAPSAEWQTTEKICLSTLAYYGVVWHELMKAKKLNKDITLLFPKNETQMTGYQMICSGLPNIFTETLIKRIEKVIKKFELYDEYKKEIDYILNFEKVLEDKKKANFDILQGWGIKEKAKKIKESKRVFLNDKEIIKKLEKEDLDLAEDLYSIPYNNDTNVGDFVSNLKQRVLATNLPLNISPIFFGVRKGINNVIVLKEDEHTGEKKLYEINNEKQKQIKTKTDYEMALHTTNIFLSRLESMAKKRIAIGLPYEERVKKNYKKFFEIFYDLNKGRIKEEVINKNTLLEGKGEYEKAIEKSKKEVEEEEKIKKMAALDKISSSAVDRAREETEEEKELEDN